LALANYFLLSRDVAAAMVHFTDEEGFGRYLDLHEQHNMMINLYDIFQERPPYLAYLTKFDKLAHIPKSRKQNNAYRKYVAPRPGLLLILPHHD
jgi:hypothetical protein